MKTPKAPEGYNTINPFIITKDALKMIEFLQAVFDAKEDPNAHTMDEDGLLLHSELTIGNSRVLVADTKPGWPNTPSLLQVYVDDVEATLERAEKRDGRVVTKPTDFYGDTFSRFIDPWGNLWWVYQHNEAPAADWSDASEEGSDTTSWQPSKEMNYIHDTLLDAMKHVGKK